MPTSWLPACHTILRNAIGERSSCSAWLLSGCKVRISPGAICWIRLPDQLQLTD